MGVDDDGQAAAMPATATATPFEYDFTLPKKVFGSKALGRTIYGEIECSNWRLNGALYMGSRALCFYGRFFRLERKIVIPYEDVSDMSRVRERGISIKTKDGEENVFEISPDALSSMDDSRHQQGGDDDADGGAGGGDMDEVLNLLLDLRQRAVEGFLEDDDRGDDQDGEDGGESNEDASPDGSTTPKRQKRESLAYSPHPLHRSNTEPIPTEEDDEVLPMMPDGSRARPSMALAAVTALADFRSFSVVVRQKDGVNALTGEGKKVTFKDGDTEGTEQEGDEGEEEASESDEEEVPKDLSKAWAEVKNETTPNFKDCALEAIKVPCDLDTFFSTFLADDAPHSLEKYLESNGDTELETSPWREKKTGDDADSGFGSYSRVIKYRHPVNAPMAPPSAMARKTQRLRRYGGHGLVVETRTNVDDVPMTDCFQLEDRLLVEPDKDSTGGAGVTITSRFEVRFVQSTMFRRIIEKTSKSEMMAFYRGYRDMVAAAIGKETGAEQAVPSPLEEAKLKGEAAPGPMYRSLMCFIVLAVMLLLVANFFMLSKISSLHITVSDLHEELLELKKDSITTINVVSNKVSNMQRVLETNVCAS